MTTRLRTLQLRRFIYILSASLLIGWLTSVAQAKPPANVGLLSFTATAQENGIRLDWETATEETEGFRIKRSLSGSDTFVVLNDIGFISSEGDITTGATYSRVDETAVYGTTYTYKLVEVESGLLEIDLETVTITFIVDPTATPIVLGGGNPTVPPTQTSIPTSTPLPTNTTPNTAGSPTATHTPGSQTEAITTPTPSPTSTALSEPESNPIQRTNTPAPVIDSTFNGNSGETGVVFAQEDEGAYPGPDIATPAPDSDAAAYPEGQPTAVPSNPTSYPAQTAVPPTVSVIGNGEYPLSTPESDMPANQEDIIRGRIYLWAGFTVAMLIFIGGATGATILYRRKRD